MKQNLAKLVTKESVLQALKKFETENPYLEPSTKYDLEYNGGYYPPKEVVREAARIQGIEIDDDIKHNSEFIIQAIFLNCFQSNFFRNEFTIFLI